MNKDKIKFLTEGNADVILLKILEVAPKYIEKTGSVTQLQSSMKKQLKYYHKRIIGLIDYDKGKSLNFFKDFELCDNPDNIILKQKPDSNQYVLFLKPKAVEKWILDAAKSVNISPENYGLPSGIKQFSKRTKNVNISKDKDFIKFIRDIKNNEAEQFLILQEILLTFTENLKYKCKTN